MTLRLSLCLLALSSLPALTASAPVEPGFRPYIDLAQACLRGPVPEAACVSVVEAACLADAGDAAETLRGKTDCALGAAQVWTRVGEEITLAMDTALGTDSAASAILTRYAEDHRAWTLEMCDLERRMEGGPLMKELATAQCRARTARTHAVRLHQLGEMLP